MEKPSEKRGAKKSGMQEQIHNLLFSKEIGWKDIIYDLINTEQLDPWDIDISLLTARYLERIRIYEESDFFISSKVLLAASLLLRIKSEALLNKYLKSIDEILFGKTEKKRYVMERIEIEEEIPELIPKSPIPRYRRVTLKELIESLNKAINTENKRIKKEMINRNALRAAGVSLPKKKFSIKNKIREVYDMLFRHFKKNTEIKKISLTEFTDGSREEKLASFAPLLYLESSKKVWLEQTEHFGEIHIWMKDIYLKHNPDPFADLREEISEGLENTDGESEN